MRALTPLTCLAGLLVLTPTAALAGTPALLDTAFATGGTAGLTVAAQHTVQCCFVVVDQRGRLLLAGNDVTAGSSRAFVQRLLPSGAPDTSYGTGGRVLLPAVQGTSSLVLTRPRLLPGGGLEVLSQARVTISSPSRNVLTRLRADGGADPAFGQAGRTVSPAVFSSSFISQFAVGPDGTTTMAVADEAGRWSRLTYAPDGTRLPGRPPIDLGGAHPLVWDVEVDAEGRTAVLGDVSGTTCAGTVPTVLRLLRGGHADPSFGTSGRRTYGGSQYRAFYDLVPLPDGGYLLADGTAYAGAQASALLVRTDGAGRLVPSFGSGGVAQFGRAGGFGATVRDGAVTQAVADPAGSSAAFRLDLATGAVVRSFGTSGRLPLSLTARSMDGSGSVAADGKGRVVVAAGVDPGPSGYATRALVRRWLPAAAAAEQGATPALAAHGVHTARPERPAC